MSDTPVEDIEVPVGIATRSGSITKIAAAMVRVQRDMRAVTKDSHNPHFESDFASLSHILDSALPILTENGLAIAQFPSHTEDGRHLLRTYLMHESGQFISDEMIVELDKRNPQGQGSAITYARRYAASAILGIRTADDDANAATEPRDRGSRRRSEPADASPVANPDTAPRTRSSDGVVIELPAGWPTWTACDAAHNAVNEQIKQLLASLSDDEAKAAVLAPLTEHKETYGHPATGGFPMVPDALTALTLMVAKATQPVPQPPPETPDVASAPPDPAPTPLQPDVAPAEAVSGAPAAGPVELTKPQIAKLATHGEKACGWCNESLMNGKPVIAFDHEEQGRLSWHKECHKEWLTEGDQTDATPAQPVPATT